MRQLWILVFLAGVSGAISAGQQIPPPPPPQPPQTSQAPPPAQPAQQTTAPEAAAQQTGQAAQQSAQQATQEVQQTAQPAQEQQQPGVKVTETAPVTQQTTTAPAQQTTTAPAAPVQQPDQATAPAAPAQQTTTAPAAPVQQPDQATAPAVPAQQTTTAPAQQPTQPTVPAAPQMPSAQQSAQEQQQVQQQLNTRAQEAVRRANEQYQLEMEAARQDAIAQSQEEARKAQAKADKAREEAQKQQARANEANQKAQSLKGGAPLPQGDRPEMSEAEYTSEFLRDREKALSRLGASYEVMREFTTSKLRISAGLIKKARCVVIIPATKRAAFVVGANYGRGVMTCRLGEEFNGPWSAPTMMSLEGGSFGFQVGVQGTDWVLLIMNERGVSSLLGSKGKLGADASIAAGPWGRNMAASTDLAMRAEILSFGHTAGIYLGASLDGSTLRPDNDGNLALYGRSYDPRDIVRSGEVRVPVDAQPLTNYLLQVSTASVEKPQAPSSK